MRALLGQLKLAVLCTIAKHTGTRSAFSSRAAAVDRLVENMKAPFGVTLKQYHYLLNLCAKKNVQVDTAWFKSRIAASKAIDELKAL